MLEFRVFFPAQMVVLSCDVHYKDKADLTKSEPECNIYMSLSSDSLLSLSFGFQTLTTSVQRVLTQ